MKSLLVSILVLAGYVSFAQVFTIKTITPAEGYSFPLIESKERPAVAKKINEIIQTDLGTNPRLPNPFDSVTFEDEYWFEAGAINERVVCLTMIGAHNGCGHHETRNNYIFDAHTGSNIDIKYLFGLEGETKMRKALHKKWVESIKPLVTDPIFGDDYKNCLAEAQNNNDIYIDRMLVNDNNTRFYAGYCLDGSSQNVDQAKGPYDLSLGEMLPMLTPNGFALFVEKSSGPVRNLLRGTIDGKYPISLMLTPGKTAGTVGGMIVYDRIGTPINLNGTIQGNQVAFHELDDSNKELSNIEVSWDGQKLTGSFTNLKTKKQMPFVASVVTQP